MARTVAVQHFPSMLEYEFYHPPEGLNMSSALSHSIEDYESLLVAMQNVLGVTVPDAQRSCLLERVDTLLSNYKLDSLVSLAEILQSSQGDEVKTSLLNAISQGHSGWELSPSISRVLHDYVFAQLLENARIWIVGCGQGQSAYALAMQITEYENKSNGNKNLKVFATDIAQGDIQQAESAKYSLQQISGLSEEYKKLYTTPDVTADSFTIKDKIRKNIHFSQCDLTQDFQSLGAMDLIICPEILVYYSNGVKAGILSQFSDLLNSGGIFLTGSSQAVTPFTSNFEQVRHSAGVFYRQKN